MSNREVRGGIPAEFRSDSEGVKVSGYAAVFNETTEIAGLFREVIVPGAFRSAIGRDDVVFNINHKGLPLARTRSGTLKLKEDGKGLHMETVLDPEDPDVRSIVPKMKRGDMNKMSFAFRATKQQWDDTTNPPTRTIQEVELYDVSIVTTPAYDGTSIALRSLQESKGAGDEARKRLNALAAQRRIAERKAKQEQQIRGIRQDAS